MLTNTTVSNSYFTTVKFTLAFVVMGKKALKIAST